MNDVDGHMHGALPFAGFAKNTPAGPRWTGEVALIPSALDWPLRKKKPLRIFVNSMSDLFHEKLPADDILRVFLVMARCPQHTFQILTKRPERMQRLVGEWLKPAMTLASGAPLSAPIWPLPNVWLGVSVENQATADERIPLLLQTPAAKRFVSYEPALGPVKFAPHLRRSSTHHVSMSVPGALRNRSFYGLCDDSGREMSPKEAEAALRDLLERGIERIPATSCDAFDEKTGCKGHPNPAIDWLIVGGESGPGARPFDIAWARSTVEQCRSAGVACFVKQMGARPYSLAGDHLCPAGSVPVGCFVDFKARKGGDWAEWPEDLRVREFPA